MSSRDSSIKTHLHPCATVALGELDRDRADRHVRDRRPVLIGEGIGELQRGRGTDGGNPPQAVVDVALRTGHPVGDLTSRAEVVRLDRRRVGGRPPPAFELARIRPKLPHALDRSVEVSHQGDGQVVVVGVEAGDAQPVPLILEFLPSGSVPSTSRSDIRSTRPRQVASSSSRACRAQPTTPASVRTSCPPTALLGDQAGPLQHGDVLLHRREAHRIGPRESRDRRLARRAAAKDVAAGGVGESMEQLVNCPVRQVIYNHMVVDYPLPHPEQEAPCPRPRGACRRGRGLGPDNAKEVR
jgi:hypothetical protein